MSRLRRAVRRAAPPAFGPLTGAQVELLRLVRRAPGVSIVDAATQLGLAANTVSTLVGHLVDAGMLARTPDPEDRRVARLTVTRSAARRIDAWRARRAVAVAVAIDELRPSQQQRLQAALRVLDELAERLGTE